MKECPNCHFRLDSSEKKCPRCGIVFEKWEAIQNKGIYENNDNLKNDLSSKEEDIDHRLLCGDGNCIGVIGPDGLCNICGFSFTKAKEREDERNENIRIIREMNIQGVKPTISEISQNRKEGSSTEKEARTKSNKERIPCPVCGHENSRHCITCKKCHINLQEAACNALMRDVDEELSLTIQKPYDENRLKCNNLNCEGNIGSDGLCNRCGQPYLEKQGTQGGITHSTSDSPKFRVVENEISVGGDIKTGCGGAILAFIIGGLVSLIPVVGWIAGPIIIFAGCIMPFQGLKDELKDEKKTVQFIEGACPYCEGELSINVDNYDKVEGRNCPICKKRFVVREKQFWSV